MMIDEFECYIPLPVEARERRAGLVSQRPVIEKVNSRSIFPASFARNPNDFVLSSFDGFAGIPHPPVCSPSWRLPPTQPSEALAKREPTGALSTLNQDHARRCEIV